MTNPVKKVTEVPYRTEPFGGIGWSTAKFDSARDAAQFVLAHPDAAERCWRRFEIVDGELTLAR